MAEAMSAIAAMQTIPIENFMIGRLLLKMRGRGGEWIGEESGVQGEMSLFPAYLMHNIYIAS